ncbi:hypothetical protein P7C70_g4422, partial [Phenoliferia sp. Uapishka_3]
MFCFSSPPPTSPFKSFLITSSTSSTSTTLPTSPSTTKKMKHHSQHSTIPSVVSSGLGSTKQVRINPKKPMGTFAGLRDLYYHVLFLDGVERLVHYSNVDPTILAEFQEGALNSEVDGFLHTASTHLSSQVHRLPFQLRQCTRGRSTYTPEDTPSVAAYRDDLFLEVQLLRSNVLAVHKTLALIAPFPTITTISSASNLFPPPYLQSTTAHYAKPTTSSASTSATYSADIKPSLAICSSSNSASSSRDPRVSRDVAPKGGASVTSAAFPGTSVAPARDDSLESALAAFMEATAIPNIL